MVQRFFSRISMPVFGLHRAAYFLAILTFASQALALFRDRIFASVFGVGKELDLYYAAFRVPDLVFALITSLVSAYVLIPRIVGMNKEDTKILLSEASSFLFVIGGLVCIFLGIFMPTFLKFLYPKFSTFENYNDFIFLARMLLLQPILLGLSGVIGSVTQVHKRFILFALSPVLYNVGIIFGAVFLYPYFGIIGIGIGVLVGAFGYLLVNVPVVINAGVFPYLCFPDIKKMAVIMHDSVPRSLALGMGSVTALALTSIASNIGTGSVSVFNFANNLESVPLALIGSSYAVAAFPALSETSSLEKRSEFTKILSASARHIILWSMVFIGIIIVLRAHIVRVVLGTGAFDWNATKLTAAILAVLVVGLAAQGLVLLFSRALYAAKQSWWPFVYQIAGFIITIFLALFLLTEYFYDFKIWFAALLKVSNVPFTELLLLALAFTVGQIFLALFSLFALRVAAPGLARTLIKPVFDGALAAILGGFVAYYFLYLMGEIVSLTTFIAVFTEAFFAGIIGLSVSLYVLFLVENEEFCVVVNALSKFLKSK